MKVKKFLIMGIVMSVMLLMATRNENFANYLNEIKSGSAAMAGVGGSSKAVEYQDALLQRIQNGALGRRVAPIDARVDRVWEAIPGYNGLEVDVEQTYLLAKNQPETAPIQWVYKEVPPKVGLDDIGKHPIYKGNPNKPMVALMINVAWGNEYLEPMLKTLEKENVKATFFLDGSWLNKNAEAARTIQSYGHEISNHAYSHPNMKNLTRTAAYNQIAKTEALLKSSLGVKNRYFAPPSGSFNQMTVDVAAEQGLKTVLWTLDTVDWKHPPPASVVQKIKARVEPGTLILMHPTDSASSALQGMIDAIKQKRLVLGTVSEVLSPDRVRSVEQTP